jgi:hypothetical protein
MLLNSTRHYPSHSAGSEPGQIFVQHYLAIACQLQSKDSNLHQFICFFVLVATTPTLAHFVFRTSFPPHKKILDTPGWQRKIAAPCLHILIFDSPGAPESYIEPPAAMFFRGLFSLPIILLMKRERSRFRIVSRFDLPREVCEQVECLAPGAW